MRATAILQKLKTRKAQEDINLREELCKEGLEYAIFGSRIWALFRHELGMIYLRSYKISQHWLELEIAINHLNAAASSSELANNVLEFNTVLSNKASALWQLAKTQPYDELVESENKAISTLVEIVKSLEGHQLPLPEYSSDNLRHYPRITVLANLAEVYRTRRGGDSLENQKKAFEYSYQALEYYFKLVNRLGIDGLHKFGTVLSDSEIVALGNLCILYEDDIYGNRHENLERAISHGELAIKLAEQAVTINGNFETVSAYGGLTQSIASLTNTVGAAYVLRTHGDKHNNVKNGVQFLLSAYSLRKEIGAVYDQAESMNNLLEGLSNLAEWEKVEFDTVIQGFELTLDIVRNKGFTQLAININHNLGVIYNRHVEWGVFKAINYLQQAIETSKDHSLPYLASSIELASAYISIDREDEAIQLIENAIMEHRNKVLPQLLQWGQEKLAGIHFRAKNWDEAIKYYNEFIDASTIPSPK